ncbi:putative UPF0676 protein [Hyaloscypha sp. PMI_1271]|nr:putative UPF0676 protein [Hyaloscypha sp. PMI_1271]
MGSIEQDQAPTRLPIIDFERWSSEGTVEHRLAVSKELADACHNELLEEAFGWSKRLFDLKTEGKMLASRPDRPTVHLSQVISEDLEKPSPGLKDPEFLLRFHSGHNNQLRLLHYPPIPAAQLENEPSARMPAPSDWGSITILFQDDCGGLEVENQHAPGRFIKVIPLKNAIVMNIGDLLMRRSNNYLKSTIHRVTLSPAPDRYTGADRMTRARYSTPYSVSLDIDARIECMSELMRAKLQYAEGVSQPITAFV